MKGFSIIALILLLAVATEIQTFSTSQDRLESRTLKKLLFAHHTNLLRNSGSSRLNSLSEKPTDPKGGDDGKDDDKPTKDLTHEEVTVAKMHECLEAVRKQYGLAKGAFDKLRDEEEKKPKPYNRILPSSKDDQYVELSIDIIKGFFKLAQNQCKFQLSPTVSTKIGKTIFPGGGYAKIHSTASTRKVTVNAEGFDFTKLLKMATRAKPLDEKTSADFLECLKNTNAIADGSWDHTDTMWSDPKDEKKVNYFSMYSKRDPDSPTQDNIWLSGVMEIEVSGAIKVVTTTIEVDGFISKVDKLQEFPSDVKGNDQEVIKNAINMTILSEILKGLE